MSTPPPSYLKLLHCDDASIDHLGSAVERAGDVVAASPDRIPRKDSDDPVEDQVVEGFWRTYSETTGWRIDPARHEHGFHGIDTNTVDVAAEAKAGRADEPSPRSMSAVDARLLADAARRLADQLQHQQQQLRSQQLELAARAVVIAEPMRRLRYSQRIERILADATLATGTQAAAVYLLDDDTQRLTTRFVFGLSPGQRLGASRPLRGARGDLEAMIQGVVVMEDLSRQPVDQYQSPEDFASGICVCLGDIELPIGTVWLFSRTMNRFDDLHTAAARLAADNLCQTLVSASDPASNPAQPSLSLTPVAESLEFEGTSLDGEADLFVEGFRDAMPVRGADETKTDLSASETKVAAIEKTVLAESTVRHESARLRKWAAQVSNWQHDTMPLGERLAPRWMIDAMVESSLSIAQSWHHWDTLPDGVISMAMCQSSVPQDEATDLSAVLDCTLARAALQAHASYRHSPAEAVTRVLSTLLQIRHGALDEAGRPSLSLFYAHVDPESGKVKMASVGDWSTLVVSKFGYRPFGASRPCDSPHDFDQAMTPQQQLTVMQPGEVMVVAGGRWMGIEDASCLTRLLPSERNASAQHRIGSTVQQALREGERSPLSAIRRMLAGLPLVQERTAITLMHEGKVRADRR